ncbi:MAG: cobalt ECF transporter T component CbiQ [Oscillatoriales cyanobacterium C42_A2020_001]|nr:cobalt ECF transporter T component CbiQ [Leptolyngbyaceae cyanobacterium C42_A2020_001]
MKLDLDVYSHQHSWMHRWEPRCKLIGLMGVIFAFAFVQDLRLLVPMLVVTASLFMSSGLPLTVLTHRLRYPGFFLLGMVLLLPFFAGETVIWQWGKLSLYQEGCLATILIAVRFVSILTIALILVASTPFLALLKALRSLGLSPILTDMLLLTYRYLHDITESLTTMRTAMRLRGGDRSRARFLIPDWRTFRQTASLAGTLLIRSYEQSERVYKAMRLRGYGLAQGQTNRQDWRSIQVSNILALGLSLVVAGGFVLAEVLI